MKSYSKNYLKIYSLQFISILLGFISIFIVMPYLSSSQQLYGVYALCISTTIFLSYADFGFLSAATKYASETIATNNKHDEINIIGFVLFIMILCSLLFSITAFLISQYPEIFIKNIKGTTSYPIASKLFIILAISAPLIVLNRVLQVVFTIRLEDYFSQAVIITSNLIKIASVFYFFSNGQYKIVQYFAFTQVVLLIGTILLIIIIKKKYSYSLTSLFNATKFNKAVYTKTKKLAFGSMLGTILWILYYEMDSLAISKLIGPSALAIFAIGASISSVLRGLFGALYNPVSVRINHLIALKDDKNTIEYLNKIITLTLPLSVIGIAIIMSLMHPLVLTWVGEKYIDSIIIAKFLVFAYLLSFITYPTGALLVAKENVKVTNYVMILSVCIYWIGILLFFNVYSYNAFAIFKLITLTLIAFIYFFILNKFMIGEIKKTLLRNLLPLFITIILIFFSSYLSNTFIIETKSKIQLLITILYGATIFVVSLAIYALLSPTFRNETMAYYRSIKTKNMLQA